MKHPMRILATLVLLLVSTVAVADGRLFSITPFHAIGTIQPTSFDTTVCPNADDVYTNTHVTGIGPVTSTDPRLAGVFHVNAMILTNAQGIGVSRDEWTITDAVTGAVKATGVAEALDADQTGPIHSSVTARLADGSFMSTMAIVTLPSPATNFNIIVEYGGPLPSDPGRGVIISRDCGGYFAADRQGYRFPDDQN